MLQNQVYDPFDAAFNPPEPTQEYWGQATVSAWACMLVKGYGKLPYDPKTLAPDGSEPRRNTCIDLAVVPLAEHNLRFDLKRQMLAEFGEWVEITLPSLKALGVGSLQGVNGAWARVEMVKSREYTNAAGETKSATAMKFVKLFDSEEKCRADFQASRGNGHSAAAAPANAGTSASVPGNGSNGGNGNGNNTERATAQAFLKALTANAWRSSGKDLVKAQELLGPILAGQPLVNKYFTVQSPEVMDLLAQEAAK